MLVTIQIVSLKDKSLTPQTRNVDLSVDRPTESIGNAIRSLIEKCSVAYKQPCLEVVINKEVRGQFIPKGKMFADKVASVNFGITEIILNTRFTTDELTSDKQSSDGIALNIAKAFGHKGTKVTVRAASANLMAVQKSVSVTKKWTAVDIEDKYRELTDPRILALEDAAKEERKALAIEKKALQITAGK